ncbi:MAG: nuclear transport factor 2 family protein [Acidobacteria bacterium]|nr:nuclear transport factor 2 family protein [Acidobacteriota bacterium]
MKRVVVVSAVLVTLIAGLAVAMHHETDALIELDKEWGSAALGQDAVDAINRIISDDVMAIDADGLGSKAAMIEAAQEDDAPTGPYMADNYEVKFLTDDVAVMVHHAGDPDPHWSLHVWQKKDDKWTVVATASAPEAAADAEDEDEDEDKDEE